MKEFLKKYLTEEQLKELEEKYLAENKDAKGLPVYISKQRLDEEIGKKKTAEANLTTLQAEMETLKKNNEGAISKTDFEAAIKKAQDDAAAQISAQAKDFELSEAIYKAKGKNVRAIKALIDPEKDLAEEIARLQKEEGYLFNEAKDDVPSGTGKKTGGDDAKVSEEEAAAMRKAVGL